MPAVPAMPIVKVSGMEVRTMDSGRAYRTSVVPLSVLLMLGGMISATLAWVVRAPITSPFPFIESEALNRHLFGIAGLACVGIGVGLLFRNRVAWYALLAYVGCAVLLLAVSVLDARIVASRGLAFPILGSLINAAIGVGLYFALRPAFVDAKGQRGPENVVNRKAR